MLSWSLLEAMAAGCPIIASDTAPVREVITHNKNGMLVDFFNEKKIADTLADILSRKRKNTSLRRAARETIETDYALNKTLPRYQKLITDIAKGKLPPTGYRNLLPKYASHLDL